jgi:predicted PurR-regulated permease PerM
MGDMTPEELGRGVRLLVTVLGIVAAIALAVIGFIKFFVTRYEYNKLLKLVEEIQAAQNELKQNQGRLTPESEAQMIKILQKIDEFFSEKQRRKNG